jgi:uncharacterized repeat protein (TIGR02543 family)
MEESGIDSKTCTVTFDANGGEDISETKEVTYGSAYGELPEVRRENYKFVGWYMFASAGAKITEDTIVTKSASHTIYAHWKGDPCDIELDANGGELEKEKITVYYGSKYINQLPIPSRENYAFDGWYTSASDGDKITIKSIFDKDSKTTLYAQWKEKSLKINLIAFNGETYEIQVAYGKSYGESYGELPIPTKENYSFGGWYTLKDYADYSAKPITEDTIVTKNSARRLFARWYIEKRY